MNGKGRRAKGAQGEREFLKILGDWLGDDWPDLQRNLQQTRNGGADCVELDGVAIEVKRQERFASAWFDQAAKQAGTGELPAVAWRKNWQDWRVFVEFSPAEFADFLRERASDGNG